MQFQILWIVNNFTQQKDVFTTIIAEIKRCLLLGIDFMKPFHVVDISLQSLFRFPVVTSELTKATWEAFIQFTIPSTFDNSARSNVNSLVETLKAWGNILDFEERSSRIIALSTRRKNVGIFSGSEGQT